MKTFRYYVYFMNEAVTVQFTSGFLKRMEIPRFMKGFVKSMTFSLHRWDSIIFICSYLKQPRWESKYIYVVISTCWSENQQWYKLDNSKLGSTQQWVQDMLTLTLTCCQDHILTENIWFVLSETSYCGDERRCYRCGTNERTTEHWR